MNDPIGGRRRPGRSTGSSALVRAGGHHRRAAKGCTSGSAINSQDSEQFASRFQPPLRLQPCSPIFKIFLPPTKQSPIRPSPPRGHPCFLAPSRDNQIEEKVAGRRASNPVSATHLRIRPANSSVCNKPVRKTGNAFPEMTSWTRKNNSGTAPRILPSAGIASQRLMRQPTSRFSLPSIRTAPVRLVPR